MAVHAGREMQCKIAAINGPVAATSASLQVLPRVWHTTCNPVLMRLARGMKTTGRPWHRANQSGTSKAGTTGQLL